MADNITTQDIRKAMYKSIEMDFNITQNTVDLFAMDIPGYYKVTLALPYSHDDIQDNNSISFSINIADPTNPCIDAKCNNKIVGSVGISIIKDNANKYYVRLLFDKLNSNININYFNACKMYTEVVYGYIPEFFPNTSNSDITVVYKTFYTDPIGLNANYLTVGNNFRVDNEGILGTFSTGELTDSKQLLIDFANGSISTTRLYMYENNTIPITGALQDGVKILSLNNFLNVNDTGNSETTSVGILSKNLNFTADPLIINAHNIQMRNTKKDLDNSAKLNLSVDGDVSTSGITQSTGADYAEYFEWADENFNNEDRVGYFVEFSEIPTKIQKATKKSKDILGVVSATANTIGRGAPLEWDKKYIKDGFGRSTGTLNPKFNETVKYTPRSKRKEWSPVGLVGMLRVYDDGSCVPGKYCWSNNAGIATKSKEGFLVVRRIEENIIEIFVR